MTIDAIIINHHKDDANITSCVASIKSQICSATINIKEYRDGQSIPKIISEVTGEYCVFLKPTYLMYKDKLAKQLKRFFSLPGHSVGLVYHDLEKISFGTGKTEKVLTRPFDIQTLSKTNILSPGYLCKTEALRDVGGYSTDPKADLEYDLMCRMSQKYLCLHIPEFLMGVRV